MRHVSVRVLLGMGLVGGLAVFAPVANAAAGSAEPGSVVKISVVPQAGGPGRSMMLVCDPVDTQPAPPVACVELADAKGDVRKVPPQQGQMCPHVWLPVDATATGWWNGKPIEPYSETISNDVCARIRHGHVLDF